MSSIGSENQTIVLERFGEYRGTGAQPDRAVLTVTGDADTLLWDTLGSHATEVPLSLAMIDITNSNNI